MGSELEGRSVPSAVDTSGEAESTRRRSRRIVDDVDRRADATDIRRAADAVDDVVDRAVTEVDRHDVVELDAGSLRELEAVIDAAAGTIRLLEPAVS